MGIGPQFVGVVFKLSSSSLNSFSIV